MCASADLTHNLISTASPTSAQDDAAAEEVTVIINNPISLLCEALPYSSPNITWLKDQVPLKASGNVLLLPGTVLLSPAVVAPCCACLGEWEWGLFLLWQGSSTVRW